MVEELGSGTLYVPKRSSAPKCFVSVCKDDDVKAIGRLVQPSIHVCRMKRFGALMSLDAEGALEFVIDALDTISQVPRAGRLRTESERCDYPSCQT